jgi:hypothetical protein
MQKVAGIGGVFFRVRVLDARAAPLRAAGIAVEIDPQHCPNGRFARRHDPEGNPVELWEPAGPNALRYCWGALRGSTFCLTRCRPDTIKASPGCFARNARAKTRRKRSSR